MAVLNQQVHLNLQFRDVLSHFVNEKKQGALGNQCRRRVSENRIDVGHFIV